MVVGFTTTFHCNQFPITTKVVMGWVLVLNATFNNISAISWLSVLLVKEMGVPGENNRSAESH
jgi:type IV secretory pathway VirB2 component (pilin)